MIRKSTKMIATLAVLFALTIVLSALESLFPLSIFGMPPGVKLGLANIVVMYALLSCGRSYSVILVILKSAFVFVTRGFYASVLSLSGGFLSLGVIILLIIIIKNRESYTIFSVFGAVFHNIGQIASCAIIMSNVYVFGYLPILIGSGVAMGILTSALLKASIPALKRIL